MVLAETTIAADCEHFLIQTESEGMHLFERKGAVARKSRPPVAKFRQKTVLLDDSANGIRLVKGPSGVELFEEL